MIIFVEFTDIINLIIFLYEARSIFCRADEDKLAVICDGRARNRSHQSGDSIELLTTNHSAHNKGKPERT